ncbi:hypothetical protein H0H87_007050, partial [Tephrocybe sp. NHM501043]
HIWDALTGALVKEFKGHTRAVQSVAFSPDGQQVVSGSNDQTVCIWDALTGDLVKQLKGHTRAVQSVAFSPDAKEVVSGSNDQTVHIWDALTGDLVKELKGHTDSVQSVAFSPDSKQVMLGSNDGTVQIWDSLTGELVKKHPDPTFSHSTDKASILNMVESASDINLWSIDHSTGWASSKSGHFPPPMYLLIIHALVLAGPTFSPHILKQVLLITSPPPPSSQ